MLKTGETFESGLINFLGKMVIQKMLGSDELTWEAAGYIHNKASQKWRDPASKLPQK